MLPPSPPPFLLFTDAKGKPNRYCMVQYFGKVLHQQPIICCVSVDTTFNLGDFYGTPTTYRRLRLEDAQSGKHPAIIGPVLVHQQLKFSSFNYFFSTLVSANKQLRHILAVGSDGNEALVQAFSHLPNSYVAFTILRRIFVKSFETWPFLQKSWTSLFETYLGTGMAK